MTFQNSNIAPSTVATLWGKPLRHLPHPPPDTESSEAALLYLNSNISIQKSEAALFQAQKEQICSLSTSSRKSAFILRDSVAQMAEKYGINNIGFLTLTFADHVICHREAQKRLNSLISNVIKKKYPDYIGCVERQKSGRIHYHLLLAMPCDIRTGFDFDAAKKRDYKSANDNLRKEWSFWRKKSKAYRFGRTEILPVKTNMEAMAKYVGKYISKHMEERHLSDKGARLVRYSRGARAGTTRFMFVSPGSKHWRVKVAAFCQLLEKSFPDRNIKTMDDLTEQFGPKWAYNNRAFILAIPLFLPSPLETKTSGIVRISHSMLPAKLTPVYPNISDSNLLQLPSPLSSIPCRSVP